MRTDLCRLMPFTMRDGVGSGDDDAGDGLTIDGYATVYGRDLAAGEDPSAGAGWAFIDSWEGTFWERFRFGAFRKALRDKLPRMQFDHGRHPLLGSLPLGRWESVDEEQDAGLHTVGRLSDNWLIEPFRDAIRDGAVDGMSIRFESVREEWRDVDGKVIRDDEELVHLLYRPDERGPLRRTITESMLPEAGPVVWPAYEATSVGVRSVTIDLGRLRDPAQRALLARAVILADAADGQPSPRTTAPSGAAGEHQDCQDDAPRTTAPSGAAGEHPSGTKPMRDAVDAWLARSEPDPHADQIRAALSLTF